MLFLFCFASVSQALMQQITHSWFSFFPLVGWFWSPSRVKGSLQNFYDIIYYYLEVFFMNWLADYVLS